MVTSQKKRSISFAASTLALEAGNKIKYTIVANCMACAHTFFFKKGSTWHIYHAYTTVQTNYFNFLFSLNKI
jgi:hypothetical protein